MTVLEPVKLAVDPALKGKHRRHAAGAALYEIMSDMVFRTTSTGRTVVDAVVEAAKIHGSSWHGGGGSGFRRDELQAPAQATAVLGAKLMPLAPEGERHGRDAPHRQWRGRHAPRGNVGGPRASDDQFHRWRGQHPGGLHRRRGLDNCHLARLRRKGQARRSRRAARAA